MSDFRNILGADVEINGEIDFKTELLFDGKLTGKINSNGNLTIGENAVLSGEGHAGTVTVFGKVEGNLSIAEHCILQPNCQVIGDVEAKSMTMMEGASFSGMSLIGNKASRGGSSSTSSASSSSSGGGSSSGSSSSKSS